MITEVINGKKGNVLSIEYMLGNLCNYKCSYCFPGSNEGTYPWPDANITIKNLDHLIEHYKQFGKTKFEFYFIGGEPTLWKDLVRVCSHLKNNHNVKIRISTNATRKIDWWKENAWLFDQIEISVHHEYVKIPHIIEVADILYKKKVNVSANVLMDPNHFEKCKGLIEQLRKSKKRWPIIAKTVHYDGQTRYDDSQKKFVSKSLKRWPNLFWWYTLPDHEVRRVWAVIDGLRHEVEYDWFVLNDLNRFKGWTCNLGVDYIEIFQDGRIAGVCGEKIYGENKYYNLYDKDFLEKFKPEIKPIVCGKELCCCAGEVTINKVNLSTTSQRPMIPIYPETHRIV